MLALSIENGPDFLTFTPVIKSRLVADMMGNYAVWYFLDAARKNYMEKSIIETTVEKREEARTAVRMIDELIVFARNKREEIEREVQQLRTEEG